jgi:hypothetical protein
MTLQLLHSEFPYTVYEENFLLFFISVTLKDFLFLTNLDLKKRRPEAGD